MKVFSVALKYLENNEFEKDRDHISLDRKGQAYISDIGGNPVERRSPYIHLNFIHGGDDLPYDWPGILWISLI